MWRAYVDESESRQRLDPDVYILAAALVEDAEQDAIQARMRALLRPGQRKLHWHAESATSRAGIIDAVAGLPALQLAVVRTGRPGERSERRRRKCLERLVYELDERGVEYVTLEARERKSNARELRLLDRYRSAGAVRGTMRMYHAAGPTCPLLWIADSLAGAVMAARTGNEEYLDRLDGLVDVVTIGPDP